MVRINIIALVAIAFGAASAAAASVRDLQLQARGLELSELIEARELAYQEFEARDLDLIEHAQELISRGYDLEEVLLFRRIDKTFKDEILDWLKQANGAAQFGANTWAGMHSGGTSVVPHCRPYGMKKTVEKEGPKKGNKKTKVKVDEYYVKMECAPNSKKPDSKTTVVSSFLAASGDSPHAAPATATVYSLLKAKVQALPVGK
ncbi:hypothetical protein BDQ17DRAFT_1371944 [Cyathus striatus]|nr:hypothetical protein BDQ17DRAFT_1371944 [Cyathus striatus]